jgi:hypothetical protein
LLLDLGLHSISGMMDTTIETTTTKGLNLESEDRSRLARRGQRLLTMMAISFVFLALCLMFVDFQRLDHLAGSGTEPRPQGSVTRGHSSPRSRFYSPHHS